MNGSTCLAIFDSYRPCVPFHTLAVPLTDGWQLLAPATDALTDPCLEGPITGYDFAEGIALMTIFVMFFIEMIAMRASYAADNVQGRSEIAPGTAGAHPTVPLGNGGNEHAMEEGRKSIHVPGGDHLGHQREHTDNEDLDAQWQKLGYTPESYSAQLTAVFILEFGVIFHSIFIGLTLAVSGDEFNTLYVVLVFHQMFEGLGLGSRLAAVPWPQGKQWTPYLLGAGYAISTPIAIAIGLGVRTSYPPNSQTTLVVNGVFDSISAGILIYTGLVELMAHEFMFSPYMQRTTNKVWLSAFLVMCLGAGLMALLGKWA